MIVALVVFVAFFANDAVAQEQIPVEMATVTPERLDFPDTPIGEVSYMDFFIFYPQPFDKDGMPIFAAYEVAIEGKGKDSFKFVTEFPVYAHIHERDFEGSWIKIFLWFEMGVNIRVAFCPDRKYSQEAEIIIRSNIGDLYIPISGRGTGPGVSDASFSWLPTETQPEVGETVRFFLINDLANSNNPKVPALVEWDFGDGESISVPCFDGKTFNIVFHPLHTYQPGVYIVRLTVTATDGAVFLREKTITIAGPPLAEEPVKPQKTGLTISATRAGGGSSGRSAKPAGGVSTSTWGQIKEEYR